MDKFDKDVYIRITKDAGVFTHREISVINDVLDDYEKNPRSSYFIITENKDSAVLGFVIFGKTPLTLSSWDIYWLVVDKLFHGKGIGKKLIHETEKFILERDSIARLRVETSIKKEFAHARNLYVKQGFQESGRIPDFYAPEDDLITYYKEIKL